VLSWFLASLLAWSVTCVIQGGELQASVSTSLSSFFFEEKCWVLSTLHWCPCLSMITNFVCERG
jgi:hypothetical protein